MRKPALGICKNKGADQLRSCSLSGPLFSLYSTKALLLKSQYINILTMVYDYTAWFVSDLVKIPGEGFVMTMVTLRCGYSAIESVGQYG